MGKVVKGIGKAIGSVFKAVGNFVGMLFSPPKIPKASANVSSESRLNASLVPEESFKIIFGETAVGTDMRFWETYGTGNNGHVQVFASACHEMTSFGNLYLDEKPVSFTGNDATGTFAGLLSRRMVLKGISGAGIALGTGTRWTVNSAMTGCSWFALIWTYNAEKLPQGIPSRITQVGKGAKVYDPRRDSTRGGVGSHRADDPATWEYTPLDSKGQPIGRNNALQMLAYTLGIKAKQPVTNLWVLRGGRGADPADIDFDTFIAAANACEAEGWYSDCILSTGDSHSTNEGILEAAAGGELLDTGGRFSYYVSTDDTANVAATFTEGDIIGDIDWQPQNPMGEQYNELPGTFTDPTALFQTRPLPLCYDDTYYAEDGYKKRAEPEKLAAVQDANQGQKLLRRKLRRSRFQGVFTASFNLRGLKVRNKSIVKLTFAPFGWTEKLFRVAQQGIAHNGGIQLILEEESPLIYNEVAPVICPPIDTGEGGDARAKIAVSTLTATATGVISGTSARDAVRLAWAQPPAVVSRTEIRYKKIGDANYTPWPQVANDILDATIEPLLPNTAYTFEVRHVTAWDVPGDWSVINRTTNAVTVSPAGLLVYSNGQTVESLRPGEAGANVTETRTAALIYGQAPTATSSDFSVITGTTRPSDNATSNLNLYANSPSSLTVRGNHVTRTANGSGWGGQGAFFSRERFVGAASVVARVGNLNGAMIGMASDAVPAVGGVNSYSEIDYCFFVDSTGPGNLYMFEGGVNVGAVGTATVNTLLQITYDGANVRYYKDGALVRTIETTADRSFYMQGDIYGINGIVKDVSFTPFTSNAWSAITNLNLVAFTPANLEIVGNRIKKVAGGNSWTTGGAYSQQRFVGSAVASGRKSNHSLSAMFGLSDGSPAGDTYANLDYAIYFEGGGAVIAYESNVNAGTLSAAGSNTVDDLWSVVYDGVNVTYLQNGVVRRTTTTTGGRSFFLQTAMLNVNIVNIYLRDLGFSEGFQVSRIGQNTYDDTGGGLVGRTNLLTSLGTAALIAGQGPGATAAGDLVLNNRTDNASIFVPMPVGAAFNASASQTGCLKIRLPQSWTNTMLRFTVDIFDYNTGHSTTYIISGFNEIGTPSWFNVSAQVIGSRARSFPVAFAHDGTKCCILIGNIGTAWAYPVVRVRDFVAGFTTVSEAAWASGWSVSFITSLAGITTTQTVAVPRANDVVFGEGVFEDNTLAAVATRADYRTSLGIAAAVVGQGPLVSFTPPSYANNAAAIAAGRPEGTTFYNTTTSALETVIAGGSAGGGVTASTGFGGVTNSFAGSGWQDFHAFTVSGVPLSPNINVTINPLSVGVFGGGGSVNVEFRLIQTSGSAVVCAAVSATWVPLSDNSPIYLTGVGTLTGTVSYKVQARIYSGSNGCNLSAQIDFEAFQTL